MNHSPEEDRLLELLKETLQVLAAALNSLNTEAPPPTKAESAYMQAIAAAINNASDGYLVLRQMYRLNASKLLVRAALEAVFAGHAIANKHGLLIRKAYSEWEEDQKMFKDTASKAGAKRAWEDFEEIVRKQDSECPIVREPLRVWDLAVFAKMEEIYNTAYRLYCKFTHNALGALKGDLNKSTDNCDSQIVIWCVFQALELLKKHTPAEIPNLAAFYERLPRWCEDSNTTK